MRSARPWTNEKAASEEDEEGGRSTGHDYARDPRWRQKLLTPAQLLVQDVRYETFRADRGPLLEVTERFASAIVPDDAAITPSAAYVRAADLTDNPIEKQQFTQLEEEYGWVRHLRLDRLQRDPWDDDPTAAKVRWIHVSSRFPEYIKGILFALSDDRENIASSLSIIDTTIQRQTRFSKHGKYFAPFFQPLRAASKNDSEALYPMLLSVPFLDWTVLGATPLLRFQVDRREGFQSSRTSAHVLRSILQHFYRLEDTSDRERSQVFAKHKPWRTNRELDLKARQWYGDYPSALNVDELWVLAVDPHHIVTFSSNQTWKSRWPPMQLSSRISDVAFRSIRNNFFRTDQKEEYTAITHAIASLAGACGMLHRNFWSDMVLCLTDRYASYLGGLQYRLHRSPSTKLVMDLMAAQEELNIVIHITREQIEMIQDFHEATKAHQAADAQRMSPTSHRRMSVSVDEFGAVTSQHPAQHRATYRNITMSGLDDPMAQLLDNLQRELLDLQDLRDNTDRLVTRTIQLVNIRLEDHGKAILVFTVVTIIFLPLNFISSFFGMNTIDIRNLEQGQGVFWVVACCVTFGVVAGSIFLAFSGGDILERLSMWRDARRERAANRTATHAALLRPRSGSVEDSSFRVLGVR